MPFTRRLVQTAFRRFGYRIVHEDYFGGFGLHPFLRCLQRLQFSPRRIIDVGANRGEWTRIALDYFPKAEYILVEPQDHLKTSIHDLLRLGYRIRWVNAGISDQPGILPFTIAEHDVSSSFVFEEAASCSRRNMRQVSVKVATLNQIVAQNGAVMPEMVKIDAEGFDLKVIAGASDLIGKTEIFVVEAGLCDDRENTLLEVIRQMAARNYQLFDITDLNRSSKFGNVWLCDLAFVRCESPLVPKIRMRQ